MAYNHGREDRKWRIWKEAEEKLLRECGVDEVTIEQIRIADRADFNSNRRFYRWTNEVKQWGAAKKMPGNSECNDDSQLSHGGFRSHFTGAIDLKNSLSRSNHNGYGTACPC
ncbi:hypothetical protein [Varibaculum timonense]